MRVKGWSSNADGLPNMSYDQTSNRITNSNYEFDQAGNQTRGQAPNGQFQRFDFDAAGRLVKIKDDNGNIIESYTYGASRQRLKTVNGAVSTYYAWGGSSVLCEYTETTGNPATFKFSKSYIYAGSRLLSTQTSNGTAEITEFHHPDRLGTKLVTNNQANTSFEQSTLPFGRALNAESTGFSNQVFTSYERSAGTGLDYANNRFYKPGQGRFTTVDPIGMASSKVANPQSLNLFAYVQNNPVDFSDPSGLQLRSYTYWQEWSWFTTDGNHTDVGPHFWVANMIWYDDGIYDNGGGGGGSSGGGNSDNNDELQKVKDGVNERLKNNPDCAKLLDKINAANVLKNNVTVGEKRQNGEAFGGAGDFAYTIWDKDKDGKRIASGSIRFNENSAFFWSNDELKNAFTKDVREKNSLGDLTVNEIKELVLIHELFHINDTEGKYNDKGDSGVSKSLNELIKDTCFAKK